MSPCTDGHVRLDGRSDRGVDVRSRDVSADDRCNERIGVHPRADRYICADAGHGESDSVPRGHL
jgi:hypothetical protein